MAITKKSARQSPTVAIVTINLGDYTSGTAAAAIGLPANAIVTSGHLVVDTAWDTGTSAAIVVGDSGTANRYLTSTSIKTAGRTALVPTGYKYTTASDIKVTITDTGTAATVGSARLIVEYIVDGRAEFSQG